MAVVACSVDASSGSFALCVLPSADSELREPKHAPTVIRLPFPLTATKGDRRQVTMEEPPLMDRCLTVLAVVLKPLKPLDHMDWHIIKCNQLPYSTSHLLDLVPNRIPTITMFYILVFFSNIIHYISNQSFQYIKN